MGTAGSLPLPLTASALMSRGLFHDRIIPPLSSKALVPIMDQLHNFAINDVTLRNGRYQTSVSTRCVRHSVPKRKLARRILSIPHPRNQMFLAQEVEKHWPELLALCQRSRVSLTTPALSNKRALQGVFDRRAEGVERAKRSVGSRFVLHADIARFYPSIYTHSIPWAIHGKNRRAERGIDLFGNLIDQWVRETQSQQTGGIPIGPDTSFLLAEIIASAIDHEMSASGILLKGTRYVDDYHLYFKSLSDAERALAELHRIAGIFELEVNDLKTRIEEIPEPIEPDWKTQLRAVTLEKDDHATSLKAIFDLASSLARTFPQDSVITYLVRKIDALLPKLALRSVDWEVLDALLLRCSIGEPAALPTVLRIFESNSRFPMGAGATLNAICLQHAALMQASEVAWALWTAKRLKVTLSNEVANAVSKVDDDIVALAALDLHSEGFLPAPIDGFEIWSSYMTAESLYSEHWLLVYEAYVQNWLPSLAGTDFVAADPYFSILQRGGVRFFDTTADVEAPESGYEEDEDYEDDEEDDDDGDDDEQPVLDDITI
jgi:hypothetical protein